MVSLSAIPIMKALAWAITHSLWQGAMIYGTLYILRAVCNLNGSARYALSLGALSAVTCWFAATWLSYFNELGSTAPAADATHIFTNGQSVTYQQAVTASGGFHWGWMSLPEQYIQLIITMYCAGLAAMIVRFLISLAGVSALARKDLIAPEPGWQGLVETLQWQLGIYEPIRLMVSRRISVPMTLGMLRPVILLPVAALNQLSLEQAEAILLHELAHIKRHDYLVNMLQTIIEGILFFNPFVWLISEQIRREREMSCDEMVVTATRNPMQYARALAILGSASAGSRLALAATGRKNELFNRIKKIMEMKKTNTGYGQAAIIMLAIISVAALATVFSSTPSIAQKSRKGARDSTSNSYSYKIISYDSSGKKTVITQHYTINGKDSLHGQSVPAIFTMIDTGKLKKTSKRIVMDSVLISSGPGGKYVFSEQTIDSLVSAVDDAVKGSNSGLTPAQIENIKKQLSGSRLYASSAAGDTAGGQRANKVRIEMFDFNHGGDDGGTDQQQAMAGIAGLHSTADYNAMLGEMRKAGLLHAGEQFTITKEADVLYINGVKQPRAVYEKYRHYLQDDSVTLAGDDNTLSVTVTN